MQYQWDKCPRAQRSREKWEVYREEYPRRSSLLMLALIQINMLSWQFVINANACFRWYWTIRHSIIHSFRYQRINAKLGTVKFCMQCWSQWRMSLWAHQKFVAESLFHICHSKQAQTVKIDILMANHFSFSSFYSFFLFLSVDSSSDWWNGNLYLPTTKRRQESTYTGPVCVWVDIDWQQIEVKLLYQSFLVWFCCFLIARSINNWYYIHICVCIV